VELYQYYDHIKIIAYIFHDYIIYKMDKKFETSLEHLTVDISKIKNVECIVDYKYKSLNNLIFMDKRPAYQLCLFLKFSKLNDLNALHIVILTSKISERLQTISPNVLIQLNGNMIYGELDAFYKMLDIPIIGLSRFESTLRLEYLLRQMLEKLTVESVTDLYRYGEGLVHIPFTLIKKTKFFERVLEEVSGDAYPPSSHDINDYLLADYSDSYKKTEQSVESYKNEYEKLKGMKHAYDALIYLKYYIKYELGTYNFPTLEVVNELKLDDMGCHYLYNIHPSGIAYIIHSTSEENLEQILTTGELRQAGEVAGHGIRISSGTAYGYGIYTYLYPQVFLELGESVKPPIYAYGDVSLIFDPRLLDRDSGFRNNLKQLDLFDMEKHDLARPIYMLNTNNYKIYLMNGLALDSKVPNYIKSGLIRDSVLQTITTEKMYFNDRVPSVIFRDNIPIKYLSEIWINSRCKCQYFGECQNLEYIDMIKSKLGDIGLNHVIVLCRPEQYADILPSLIQSRY